MKYITKRDLAEIVLVMIVLGFMFYVFSKLALEMSLMHPFQVGLWKSAIELFHFGGAAFLIILACLMGVLWKRKAILVRLFPESDSANCGVAVPKALAGFPFWIRLFGAWILLSQSVELIGYLFPSLSEEVGKIDGVIYVISGNAITSMANMILGIVIIWLTSAMARLLGAVGHCTETESAEDLPSDGMA